MTEKELLILAIADLESKCLFLKQEIPKLAREIRSLNEEVYLLKKTGGLICS